MPRFPRPIAALIAAAPALAFAFIVGCNPAEPGDDPEPAAGVPEQNLPEPDPGEGDAVELNDEQIENIEMLPEGDVELAMAQKICPISGEPLGDMGVPEKVDLDGTAVFVCCGGCVDAAKEDPAGTLAKLGKGDEPAAEAEAAPEAGDGA